MVSECNESISAEIKQEAKNKQALTETPVPFPQSLASEQYFGLLLTEPTVKLELGTENNNSVTAATKEARNELKETARKIYVLLTHASEEQHMLLSTGRYIEPKREGRCINNMSL
jgi:hypothetical protein